MDQSTQNYTHLAVSAIFNLFPNDDILFHSEGIHRWVKKLAMYKIGSRIFMFLGSKLYREWAAISYPIVLSNVCIKDWWQ